ncbi:hypothetical protein SMD22_00320 (plasmid) [Brevibacillus halotolerans]|nr:hypothetical protein SMD22_00320 [Brevibacillus halotolerans]
MDWEQIDKYAKEFRAKVPGVQLKRPQIPYIEETHKEPCNDCNREEDDGE